MLLIMIGPTCPSLPRRPPSIDPGPSAGPRIVPSHYAADHCCNIKVKTEMARMHKTRTVYTCQVTRVEFPPYCAHFQIYVTTHVTGSRDYVRDARAFC